MAGIGNMLCSRPKQAFKVGRSDHGFFVGLSKTLGIDPSIHDFKFFKTFKAGDFLTAALNERHF